MAARIVAQWFGAAGVLTIPLSLGWHQGLLRAMIFLVVDKMIPNSKDAGNVDLSTICLMLGFTVVMTLDVALG